VKPKKKPAIARTPEPRPSEPYRWRRVLAAASLALVTSLAYANSFSAGFILDNKSLLLKDPRIRELTFENLRLILQHTYAWPNGETGLYRPFTTLSYLSNYVVLANGQDPLGYHAINLLLHLGNVFLVFALARLLLRGFWPSFFAAALWAVHPVLTESVTNIIGRSDLLSAMAVLSGFLLYLRATAFTGGRRFACLAGLAAVTTIGVFSKENSVVIVGVIALYELTWRRERKPGRTLLLGCAATLLPIAVMLYLRSRVLAASLPAEFPFTDNPIMGANFYIGRLTAIKVIARYLGLILWPATLSSDYSYNQIPLFRGSLQDWLACLAVLAAAVLVVGLYKWNRTAFFFASFAAITFVPTSNLLFPIGTIMAERLLYLPAVGLIACLAMGIYAAGKRVPVKHFAPIVLGLIVAAFAVRTWVRNGDWQNQLTMAEASVRSSPDSFKVHRLLASTIYENDVQGSSLDGAMAEADRAVQILDPLPDAHNAREVYRLAGGFHLAKGDAVSDRDPAQSKREYQRARELLERAIAIDEIRRAEYERNGGAEWARRHPDMAGAGKGDPEAPWMLAATYWRLRDVEKATAAASQALTYHPEDPEGYRQIASIFAGQDQIDGAALALMEGGLITSDLSLRSDLVDLYRKSGAETCALTVGPSGPALNLSCEQVHKPFCAAYVEAVKAAIENGQLDAARKQKQEMLHQYGCPAGALVYVLPD
jgi:tetratricopeptide (TPR) repeat protein